MIEEKIYELSMRYSAKQEKKVRVYVPEHERGEELPVIYMTDGQNLFEENEFMYGCWHIPEVVKEEREKNGLAAIIVGIHNDEGPMERAAQLTPASIGKLFTPPEVKISIIPEGEVFDDFVINTVMPTIESRFPVKKGRASTAFCGSSSGGLQCFFTTMSHPDIFSAAGVFSPCFMVYYPEDMKNWIQNKIKAEKPYLYIYSGGADELEKIIRESVEQICNYLNECYPSDLMKKVILTENRHHESAWEAVFKDFMHLFLTQKIN